MELSFDGFELKIKDFIERPSGQGVLFITDSELKTEDFNIFLEFYKNHCSQGEYFQTMFPNRSFYGRFGQLRYSKHQDVCKLRLVLVQSKCDLKEDSDNHPKLVSYDLEYTNLLEKVAKQDIILERLKEVLSKNSLFTNQQIDSIFSVSKDDILYKQFEISGEIIDLDQYLKEEQTRLDDIRESSLN